MNNRRLAGKNRFRIQLTKRQQFIVSVLFLTLILFFSESILGKSGFYLSFFLAVLTCVLLYLSNVKDIRENFSWAVFLLPFFYTLAFGLFFFLTPARLSLRLVFTLGYGIGLYSLFLTQNIFTVASIRTIALLASARTVSFIITLVSLFFLSNIIFTLRFWIVPTVILEGVATFFLTSQSLWTITLDKSINIKNIWVFVITFCIMELSLLLWFWPANPTIIALFITGFFYTIVGPSQVWLERRLFKGVMWEYIWVAFIVMLIFITFTSWGGIID